MLNTSKKVSQGERNKIIENYIEKLKVSGYNKVQRKKIIEAGLKGYQAKVEKSQRDGTDLHRSAESTIGKRYRKKLTEKSNWFRKTRKNDQENDDKRKCEVPKRNEKKKAKLSKSEENSPVSIIFVPRTPGGELVSRLRQAEAELTKITGDRIKFVERSGIMLKNLLHKNNPNASENCGRLACQVCGKGTEKAGWCKRRNICYKTTCLACRNEGKDVAYYGETSWTAYERGLEHASDHATKEEDSHMYLHQLSEHGDAEKVEFSMEVIKMHKSAFERQVYEAVIIQMNEGKNILNARGEYNRCKLPRLGTMLGDHEMKENEKKSKTGAEKDQESEIDKERHKKRKEKIQPLGRENKRRKLEKNQTKQHLFQF